MKDRRFMIPVPKVGETYQFYDDGKLSESRQYNATVLRIITKNEAKEIMFPAYRNEDGYITTMNGGEKEEYVYQKSLFRCWLENAIECFWIYTTRSVNCRIDGQSKRETITDYFVECSIPLYDLEPIWFARTTEGGWFSLDIHNSWQGGELDVDGSLTKQLEKAQKEYKEKFCQ